MFKAHKFGVFNPLLKQVVRLQDFLDTVANACFSTMSVYEELTFCLYVLYPVSSDLSKMVPVSVVLSLLSVKQFQLTIKVLKIRLFYIILLLLTPKM